MSLWGKVALYTRLRHAPFRCRSASPQCVLIVALRVLPTMCCVSSPWRLHQEVATIELRRRRRRRPCSLSTSTVRSHGAWAEQQVSTGEVRKRVAKYGAQAKYSAQAKRSQTPLIREAASLSLISCSRLMRYMTYLSLNTTSLLTPTRSS